MMKGIVQQLFRCALIIWLAIPLHAQSTRIAVVGDTSLANLVDLTTAELSKSPDLDLVERSELAKLGQEKALQTVINANELPAVQFVPADGLVILRAVKQADGKVGILARLVAVQPGVVLREMPLPTGDDPAVRAQALAKEFAPYWAKLGAIKKGDINALSLLGVRFEVDSVETRVIERQINVLLASRLSAEPETVVLERWRLNDAVFEKSLGTQPATPFWSGSSLIDGSMTWKGKTVTVALRVRPPAGTEVSISDQDSIDHLAALVGRLADKIQIHRMTETPWQPADEANHFAQLGRWCLDNRLLDQGAEAIESAIALGDPSRATRVLQLQAYEGLSFPEGPVQVMNLTPSDTEVAPESLPDRVKWATLAAELAGNLLNDPDSSNVQDSIAIDNPALTNCLKLLRFVYQKGFNENHDADVTALRHAIQDLINRMAEVLKTPSPARDAFLTTKIRYAPFWHESPEATLTYYRELLESPTDGETIRTELFLSYYFGTHAAYLASEAKTVAAYPQDEFILSEWSAGSPRLIAWEERPWPDMIALWNNFLKELRASPDPVLQADALKFQFSFLTSRDYAQQQQSMKTGSLLMTLFLEQNQQAITGPRGNDLLFGFENMLHMLMFLSDQDPANRDRLRALGETLLQQHNALPVEWFRWMSSLYFHAPPTMAKRVLAELDSYIDWSRGHEPQDAKLVEAIDAARRPLVVYAGGNDESGTQQPLTVSLHWPIVMENAPGTDIRNSICYPPSVMTAENKIWFVYYKGKQIGCVDPSTLQSVYTYSLPAPFTQPADAEHGGTCLEVTPDYLVAALWGRVLLCSRADNSWRALVVPPSSYLPRWIHDQLYLAYDTESDMETFEMKGDRAATAISGLIHVTLPGGGIENLVSTRRIPPQTSLDGKPMGFPLDLWSSANSLMLAVDANSPHFQVFTTTEGKNDWTSLLTDPVWCDVKNGTGGELIGKGFDAHGFGQVALLTGVVSELLLSNPNRAADVAGSPARWDFPADLQKIPADVLWRASPVMRGDDLYLYCNVTGATNDLQGCLYYFEKSKKSGVRIPLHFQAKGDQDIIFLKKAASYIHNFQSLQTTDYGLVLVQEMGGFWVIPWIDIDAYREKPNQSLWEKSLDYFHLSH